MKNNFLLITGGTGGHVIPAQNLGNYILKRNNNCTLLLDKRGEQYLENFEGKINIINSSNMSGNIFKKILGLLNHLIGFKQTIS